MSAQSAGAREADHTIVWEIGPAAEWSRAEGAHGGATVAFEITPIEDMLELEFGATAIRSSGAFETSIDALAKKPWQFSPKFEFMLGVGPELVREDGVIHGGASGVLDFMFWTRPNVGWYFEPGYEAVFRPGTPRHAAMALGVIIGR